MKCYKHTKGWQSVILKLGLMSEPETAMGPVAQLSVFRLVAVAHAVLAILIDLAI
jgi:hypothetical protein